MKKSVTFVKVLSLGIALSLAPSLVDAQQKNSSKTRLSASLPEVVKTSEMNNFHAQFSGENITTDYLVNNFSEWLHTDDNHSFQFISSSVDNLGFKRSVYQHYYKNVLVADEKIYIHERDGKVTYVNGELTNDLQIDIVSPLDKTFVENLVKEDMGTSDITFDDYQQVIVKVYQGKGVEPHLVSQINVLSLKLLKGYMYYVDNVSKKIVKRLEKIHHHSYAPTSELKITVQNKPTELIKDFISPLVDTSSTSATYYKGNQNITVDSQNENYILRDNARNIHTRNGSGWDGSGNILTGELTGNITEYTSTSSNFTTSATRPAVEVHWGMKLAKDYYNTVHNRNSYDGNGSIIRNYYNVNFGSASAPDGANAAAIDSQGIVAMVYGDGFYGTQNSPTTNLGVFNPYVGVDVAGHEYSHLIVSRTANLAYERESGALNESFADMFGAAIEFYSGVTPNWNIGEGLCNPAYIGTTYLRSMSNPKAGPAVLSGQQPDTYLTGTYWLDASSNCNPIGNPRDPSYNDSCGVHTNSGVGNKWFYLLSQGGTGTNDNGRGYSVNGITIQKAEKIAYRTLASYLTPNSAYINAYEASKQAAIDIYGAGSNELQQVENAWCAVGLGNCANLLSVSEAPKDIQTENIKIFPNPVSNGEFTIDSSLKGAAEYEIYDLSGKLVKKAEKLEKGYNKIKIHGVASGVYYVIINTEGNTITKKIINK